MSIKPLARDYTMSDPDLIIYASNLVGFLTRDTAEFLLRGVSVLDITALGTKEDEFEAFPTDQELKADVTIAVEDKDLVRVQLFIAIRRVSDRALIKWGENSGRYNRFGVKGLSEFDDRKLHSAAREVVRSGTKYLTELTDEGLTQIILDDLTALAESFELKINDVSDAIGDRDENTEDRIELGNELYALVIKYCNIGKQIWSSVSEAKYNDYIVYITVHSGLSKPQNLTAVENPTDPMKVEIDFDVVENATSYKLYSCEVAVGFPSTDFTLLSTSETNHFDAPLIPDKRNYWKVRAYSADKKSDYSSEVYIDS